MNEERISRSALQDEVLRGQAMKTPDDVEEMLRLKACGWGAKRIAKALGCSHHTVKAYVDAGGVKPFKAPERAKLLDGLGDWLRERFIRHRGNADVVRGPTSGFAALSRVCVLRFEARQRQAVVEIGGCPQFFWPQFFVLRARK